MALPPRLTALAPAAVALAFGGCVGTLPAVGAGQAIAAHAILLAVAATATTRDPLRLGRAGGFLAAALGVALLTSAASSPVPRAGVVGLSLLPAFAFLAAAVAGAWTTPLGRRWGSVGVAAAVMAIGGWALASWRWLGTPGTSLPLGHHNLLAAFLVALLPLAALGWRDGGAARALATMAVALGGGAVLASGSLSGAAGLATVAAGAFLSSSRRRPWTLAAALGAVLAIAVSLAPRLLEIARGADPSLVARGDYLRAGVAGLLERPALGWGPGSSPWTVSAFLRPVPGIHPRGELVPDLHSLPLGLAYETGASGLLLAAALIGLFVRRRVREAGPTGAGGSDGGLLRAGLLALLGLGVTSLGGLPLAVLALPVAAALGAGAILAATAAAIVPPAVVPPPSRLPRIYVACAALVLLPLDLAHLAYDRARVAPTAELATRHLRTATGLDPGLPLYAARRAWLDWQRGVPDATSRARDAAEGGVAVAPLWLAAGTLGVDAGAPWTTEALLAACDLDPLGPFAPFLLAARDPGDPAAPERAARAIAAEPRLLASPAWDDAFLARVAAELEPRISLPAGWRRSILAAIDALAGRPRDGATVRLVLAYDAEPSRAASLHLFRRSPWPTRLLEVPLVAALVPLVEIPPAAELRGVPARFFAGAGCRIGVEKAF